MPDKDEQAFSEYTFKNLECIMEQSTSTDNKWNSKEEAAPKESSCKDSASKETASAESTSEESASTESTPMQSTSKERASEETKLKETASQESPSREVTFEETKSKESASEGGTSEESLSEENASKESTLMQGTSTERISDETTLKESTPKEGISEEATLKESASEESTSEESASEENLSEDITSNESSFMQSTLKEKYSEETTSKESASEEGTSEETALKESLSEENASKERISEETTSKAGLLKESTYKEGTSEETTSKESVSEESSSEGSLSEENASKENTSMQHTSKESNSEETTSKEGALKESTYKEGTSEETTSQESVSEESASEESLYEENVSKKSTSMQSTSKEKTSKRAASKERSSKEGTSKKSAPEESTSIESPFKGSPTKEGTSKESTSTRSAITFVDFRVLVDKLKDKNAPKNKQFLLSKTLFHMRYIPVTMKKDLKRFCRLLVPDFLPCPIGIPLQQLATIFSKLCQIPPHELSLDSGLRDLMKTILHFFGKNKKTKAAQISTMAIADVDDFINKLDACKKEADRVREFHKLLPCCTPEDLETIILIINNKLEANITVKDILDTVHPDAYLYFWGVKNMDKMCDRYLKATYPTKPIPHVNLISCRSVAEVLYYFTKGVYAEVTYTRERIHLHKMGLEIKYYEQTKTAALPHLFSVLKHHIYNAFPYVQNLILECEVMRFIYASGIPVRLDYYSNPPGGIENLADLCVYVTDCMYYEGDLSKRPYRQRMEFTRKNMIEVPNWVELPKLREITNLDDLKAMIEKLLSAHYATGLLLKDSTAVYDAGSVRHLWLSKNTFLRKKDSYLLRLVMVGATNVIHYETGHYRVAYLLACYDEESNKFVTVSVIERKGAHDFNKMDRIYKDAGKVPDWLVLTPGTIPEYVAKDPEKQAVWTISGLELLKDRRFTANSISPLCPEFRGVTEGDWKQATRFKELQDMYDQANRKLLDAIEVEGELLPGKSQEPAQSEQEELPLVYPTPRHVLESQKDLASAFVPRPRYFEFVRLYLLPEVIGKQSRWVRVFIECGGIVIPEGQVHQATHVLHWHEEAQQDQNFAAMKHCRHIYIDWIKDTVLSGTIKDIRAYTVKLIPKRHYR